MFIHEAVQAARNTGGATPCITRKSWARWSKKLGGGVKIQPTDSPDGCIVESDAGDNKRRSWVPSALDLMADDWVPIRL